MKGILEYLESLAIANPLIQSFTAYQHKAFLVHANEQKYPLMNVQLIDKIVRENDTIEDTVTIILLDRVKQDRENTVYVHNDCSIIAHSLIKQIAESAPNYAVINEPQMLYLEDEYGDQLAGITMDVTIKSYAKLTD